MVQWPANSASSFCPAPGWPTRSCGRSSMPGDADDLLVRLQRGDALAFEELVRRYSGRLLRAARRILMSEEDARDAVQDAFVAAFRAIGGYETGARLSTWLHRI